MSAAVSVASFLRRQEPSLDEESLMDPGQSRQVGSRDDEGLESR